MPAPLRVILSDAEASMLRELQVATTVLRRTRPLVEIYVIFYHIGLKLLVLKAFNFYLQMSNTAIVQLFYNRMRVMGGPLR